MSVVPLPSGRWRVQIRRKQLKVNELYDTEEAARAAEQEALELLKKSARGDTLSKLWPRYEASQLFEDKSDNTQRTERTRIKPVLDKLGDCTLSELEANTGLIYDYMDARRKVISGRTKQRIGATSVRLEIAALSALVEFAKTRRLVRENFVSHVSRPATKRRSRRIAADEQGKLAVAARAGNFEVAQAARFLLLIRHLGCRPGELKELLVDDVRLERSELLFRDTKNGTDRCVHVTSEAAQLLHLQLEVDYPEECPYVFPTWSMYKKAWVPYNYAHGVNVLRDGKVIAKEMHAHAGRREFISRAIEQSVPLTTVKKQTGHKSVQALEIYDNGLSTAPGIRAELDKLAATVQEENLMGAFEAAGITPEQRAKLLKMLHKDGWVAPFAEARKVTPQAPQQEPQKAPAGSGRTPQAGNMGPPPAGTEWGDSEDI